MIRHETSRESRNCIVTAYRGALDKEFGSKKSVDGSEGTFFMFFFFFSVGKYWASLVAEW